MTEPVAVPDVAAGPEQEAAPAVPAYDTHYARPVMISPEDIKANPGRFEPVGGQLTSLVGPDGKLVQVPAFKVQDSINKGFDYLPDDAGAREGQVEWYARKHGGAYNVGAESMANQLLFGVPDVLYQHRESPEELAGRERAQERDKTAHYVGGAAGIALQTAVTAGAGSAISASGAEANVVRAGLQGGAEAGLAAAEQVAPGMAQRVATAAGKATLEGMAWSAPQAVAQAAYGDYAHAGESIAWGAGTGFLIGGVGGLLSEGLSAASRKAGEAKDKLVQKAIEKGFVDEQGRADFSKLVKPEDVQKIQTEAAQRLEQHAGLLDKEIAKAPAGVRKGLGVVPTDLANEVSQTVLESRGLAGGVGHEEERDALQRAIKKISGFGEDPVSFEELQKLRQQVSKIGADAPNIARQVDEIIASKQLQAMGQAYNAVGGATKYADYLATLERLHQTAAIGTDMSHPAVQQAMANWGSSALSNIISGKVGGALGGVIGGPLGAFVGYKAAKPLVDSVVQKFVQPRLLGLTESAVSRVAGNPNTAGWLGAVIAKNAVQAATQKALQVPTVLATRAAVAVKDDVLKGVLGPEANGLSKAQQYDRVTQQLAAAKANPDAVGERIQALNQVFGHDPRLQAAVASQNLKTVDYLYSAMPKDDRPPQAFAKNAPAWQPSLQQRRAFMDKLEVANDPGTVLNHVMAGDLSAAHVDALTNLYPQFRQQVVSQVAQLAHDPNAPELSTGVKHSLSLLTGIDMTNQGKVNYQAAAYQPAQGGPPPGPGPGKKQGGEKKHKMAVPSLATGMQKLEYK